MKLVCITDCIGHPLSLVSQMWEKWTYLTAGPDLGAQDGDSKVKLCSTWDHFPVYAMMQEDNGQRYRAEEEKVMGKMEAVR